MIWGYVFSPGRPAQSVGSQLLSDGIDAALASSPEAFLWLHFALSNAATTRWLRVHLSLPEAFFSSLEEEGGETFRSPVELVSRLLRDQAELLVDIVRKNTGRVNHIEDKLLSNRISTNRRELSSMRRALVRLQRLLAPEPAALFRLLNRPPSWISAEDIQDLHQAAEEFSAAVGDSASLTERLKLLQ